MTGPSRSFKVGIVFFPDNSLEESGTVIPLYSFQVHGQIIPENVSTVFYGLRDRLIEPLCTEHMFRVLEVFAFFRDSFTAHLMDIQLDHSISVFTENHRIPSAMWPPVDEDIVYLNNTQTIIAEQLLPFSIPEVLGDFGVFFTFEDLNETVIVKNNGSTDYVEHMLMML